jgi:hypothetical protein
LVMKSTKTIQSIQIFSALPSTKNDTFPEKI